MAETKKRRRHPRRLRRRSGVSRRPHAGDRRDHPRLRLQARAGRQGLQPVGRGGARRRRGDVHLAASARDEFGAIARQTWTEEGVDRARRRRSPAQPTGAAFIYVNDESGENAIIIVPGAAAKIAPEDVEAAADAIRGSAVFVTQLEQPIPAAKRGLEIARAGRRRSTVFNPAPAGAGRRRHLRALRLRHAERERGGAADRAAGHQRRRGAQGRRCAPEEGRGHGADHARRGRRALPRPGAIDARPGLQRGNGGGDGRRGRRLQRRLRRRARERHGAGGGGALRLRRRRHLGDARRHRAVDAVARGSRGAARPLTAVRGSGAFC